MRPRCGASASKNKAACSIVAGVRSSSASTSRRSPAASTRALARRASDSETRSVDRRAAIARQRQRDLDLFALGQPRDQRGVEIGATRDGARLRRVAVGRRGESLARQRDSLGERDQRRLAAQRLDDGERVGRRRIGREPAREGGARRFVGFAERRGCGGENGRAARRGGRQSEEAIGGDPQPQMAVGGTRAGGQSVEKRQTDRREIGSHASRFLLRRRNFDQPSCISLTKY